MKRTRNRKVQQKPTVTRKRTPISSWTPPTTTRLKGGHIYNPPDNCYNIKHTLTENGSMWLDLLFCAACEKQCAHYKGFKKDKDPYRFKSGRKYVTNIKGVIP